MAVSSLDYLTTLQLKHRGQCALLGVSPDLTVYAEELHGPDERLAQSALRLDGTVAQTAEESAGSAAPFRPLMLPPDAIRPQMGTRTTAFNYSGARLRGLRAAERVDDVVYPLPVPLKMRLVQQHGLDIPPPLLLGLAESCVLAETLLRPPDMFVVCRRIRLAYALPDTRLDDANQPYDYDTLTFHIAHLVDRAGDDDGPITTLTSDLPGAPLHQPTDCLICAGHLFIADSGQDHALNAVHIWRITGVTG
jgi:hypothetical protein